MCWRDIRSSNHVLDSIRSDTELYCQRSPRETTAFRRTLPCQLESFIPLLYGCTGIFLSCTHLHSNPFKLHALPSPPKNWTIIMFAEKQLTLLYCINKMFKTLQVLYNPLLTQLCVRFLCILRPTWQWCVPVPEHNQTLEILLCGSPSTLANLFTGKHSKIAYKWCRDISRQHEPHDSCVASWCLKFSNVSWVHNIKRIVKTTLVNKPV